eukprot:scaffold8795_cov116-Isochrysis_galbana.AAC.1
MGTPSRTVNHAPRAGHGSAGSFCLRRLGHGRGRGTATTWLRGEGNDEKSCKMKMMRSVSIDI